MTLELSDEIYEAVQSKARAAGLQPAEWVVKQLHLQTPALRPGSPAAILRALEKGPRLASEDVDALEQAIKEGALPVDWTPLFGETEEEGP
jgi:hypothetical protein